MLTEKFVNDYAWCPYSVLEPQGKDKRIIPDWGTTIWEDITGVFHRRRSSEKVYLDTSEEILTALPYSGTAFWLPVEVSGIEIIFSLPVTKICTDSTGIWTIYRNPRRLYDETRRNYERYLAIFLCEFRKLITVGGAEDRTKVVVQPEDGSEWLRLEDYSQRDLYAARAWVKRIDQERENEQFPVNHMHCPTCFWKACPRRYIPEPIIPEGQSRYTGILE